MIEDHKHREKVTQMRNQDPGFELIINFFFLFNSKLFNMKWCGVGHQVWLWRLFSRDRCEPLVV
jgi:hypothetical protein